MPFHVEVRRSFRRAWAFNLDETKLRRTIIEPWRRGSRLALGGQDWDPRECTLKVLEGPALEAPDLAHGRGWQSAERSGQDVTARVLDRSATDQLAVAILAETEATRQRLAALIAQLGMRPVEWAALRARVLAAATVVSERPLATAAGLAVVIAVERAEPDAGWLFDVGLALGALGGRAIAAQVSDDAPPAALRDLGVVRLVPDDPASVHMLAERLRHAR